ncbi:recombinase family protein [bacterium]|nr:recombinase family protein [bacterium]
MKKKRRQGDDLPLARPDGPKVYGYARVSTFRQTGGQSIETQHEQLSLLAQRHGFQQVDRIFTDEEASGGTPIIERPAGRELCHIVSPGDVVLLTDLDRAFRSTSDALDTLLRWHSVKVRVIIQSIEGWGNVDFSTPIGEFFLTVLVAVKKLERNQRVSFVMQCSRDAAAKAAAEGWDGSSRRYTPIGYEWGYLNKDRGKTTLIPVPFDQETIAIIGWLRDRRYAYDMIRDQILPEINRHQRTRSSRRQVGNTRAGYRRYDITTFKSPWQWTAMDKARAWCREHPDEQQELIRRVVSQHPEWAIRWGLEEYIARPNSVMDSKDGHRLTRESTLHSEEIGAGSHSTSFSGEVNCGGDRIGRSSLPAMARSETLPDGAGSSCDRDCSREAEGPSPSERVHGGDTDGGEGGRTRS